MADLIDNDPGNFGDQRIEINSTPPQNNDKMSSGTRDSKTTDNSSQQQSENKKIRLIERLIPGKHLEEKVAEGVTEKAKEKIYKSWLDRYLCCFNWLEKYFKINSKEFLNRVIQSIIPFNSKFYDSISEKPDFYGPFWIYTTFVIFVSSCGALTRTIQGKRDSNFYQEFIPSAAVLIYFIGFGVPIFISLLSKLFGASINIAPLICTYGYSYTIFLPITIICSIPISILQWIFLGYAIVSSSSLIIMSISKSFSQVKKGRKIAIIVIIIIFQLIVFFMLKFYFFKHINQEIDKEEDKIEPDTSELIKTIDTVIEHIENTIAPAENNSTQTE